MCVQIIHNQDDFLNIRIHHINKILDFFCPINSSSAFSGTYMMFSAKRFDKSEYTASTIANIFIVFLLRISTTCRQWFSCFAKKLIRHFIHAYNRLLWIIGHFINIKNIFHTCNKFSIMFLGNAPIFTFMWF